MKVRQRSSEPTGDPDPTTIFPVVKVRAMSKYLVFVATWVSVFSKPSLIFNGEVALDEHEVDQFDRCYSGGEECPRLTIVNTRDKHFHSKAETS